MIAKKDPTSGIEQLSIHGDDDDEEDQAKLKVLTAEEQALKAQKEREEKQRKYNEARQRLFGAPTASPDTTSARSNTPVRSNATDRGKGRGRGGAKDAKDARDSRPTSSQSSKLLYDPNYTSKPDSVYLQRKEALESPATPRIEDQVIRNPRGPDGSGRGGIGFAKREDPKA